MNQTVKDLAAEIAAGLLGLLAAGGTALLGGQLLGLHRASGGGTIWIIDEGMIAFMVSIGAGGWAARMAAEGAPPARAAWLGALAGALVAVVVLIVSAVGVSEGAPIGIAGLAAAFGVGKGLRKSLNPPPDLNLKPKDIPDK